MKFALIPCYLFFAHTLMAQNVCNVAIGPESTFTIKGTSNVNKFSCGVLQGLAGEDKKISYYKIGRSIHFNNTLFTLDLKNFDCGNRHITSDFKKALKATEYPTMVLQPLSIIGLLPDDDREPIVEMRVTIAGQSKEYHLKYQVCWQDDNDLILNLKSVFDMRDFNIKPPITMMGLIKVDDEIIIELNLHMKIK